jgi:DMSO/TMAO reductase YedYZ molybdopterin-dependent catalytic subunit
VKMKRSFALICAFFGLLTSLVVIGLSFLVNYLFDLPFLPLDIFKGLLGESAITNFSKPAQGWLGSLLIVITGVVFGLVLSWVALSLKQWLMRAALIGGLLISLVMLVDQLSIYQSSSFAWGGIACFSILIMAWSMWLNRLIQDQLTLLENAPQNKGYLSLTVSESITRRNFFTVAVSSLASLVVILTGIGKSRPVMTSPVIPEVNITPAPVPTIDIAYGPENTSGPAASPSQAILDARIQPAPGARNEITDVQNFFRVDINIEPPVIDASLWGLTVNGLVQTPTTFTLDDLVAMPSQTQAVTIGCISNIVGGELIGGNYWTGVPVKTILDKVGVKSSAQGITIGSVDGFFENMPLSEAMDGRTLLVYAMNGQALTASHGYPLRIYIPNHYGMKQPKWITTMQLVNTTGGGYWEGQGWSQTAIPQTTSIFDTRLVNKATLAQNGVFPLGGIAFAGARGISKVELQFNNSDWIAAELRTPPVSPLNWVQWRYDWKPTPGSYQVRVRATDGDGNVQVEVNQGSYPDGATGLAVVNFQI